MSESVPKWVKSSLSFANSNCVEVASLPDGGIGVRDSKNPEGPVLRFTTGEWEAFLGGVRNGEFDAFTRPVPAGARAAGYWQMFPWPAPSNPLRGKHAV